MLRFDAPKPLIIASVLLTLGSVLAILAGTLMHAAGSLFLACYVVLAISNGASPASLAVMKEMNRPDSVGQVMGLFNTASYLAVGVLANLAGVVLDRFSDRAIVTASATIYPREAYLALFSGIAVVAVASVVSSFFVRETRGESRWAG